ncbi:MAG: radical SAM protein [Ktedonobacteraceae bacterium]|nr:radical SAM protein [Ktedonobacteraceae bacterium]
MDRRILFTVEHNRVLVPVGEPCPFGCRYCYTRGGEVGLSRVSPAEILARFRQFARQASFETIQFGYDGDPFARPERGLAMLQQLGKMRKHLNFSTKAALDAPTLRALQQLRQQMEAVHTTLSALVSVSCWESASVVEPHTPSPQVRMQTVANLARMALPVFLALRPVLPHIADREYERIIEEGLRAGCEGFILGPLYADARGQFVRFVPKAALTEVEGRKGTVSWSAHAPRWTRYEDPVRLQRLQSMIERKGGRSFLSSAEAMERISRRGRVA